MLCESEVVLEILRACGSHEVVGFIDDDKEKQGQAIRDIKVIGRMDEVPTLMKKYGIQGGIVAIGNNPQRRELSAQLSVSPATVSHGWQALARSGLVVSRGRSGTFVTDVAASTASSRPAVGKSAARRGASSSSGAGRGGARLNAERNSSMLSRIGFSTVSIEAMNS